MSEEELQIPSWGRIAIFFIFGLIIGGIFASSYHQNREYRNPGEVADELEKILFDNEYAKKVMVHKQGAGLLFSDTTTLGEIRHWYKRYPQAGRDMLKLQIDRICYKEKWRKKNEQ